MTFSDVNEWFQVMCHQYTYWTILFLNNKSTKVFIGQQHRKDIDLYLKPFRGNNNIINVYTSYEKNVQLSSNKYLLLLLLFIIVYSTLVR